MPAGPIILFQRNSGSTAKMLSLMEHISRIDIVGEANPPADATVRDKEYFHPEDGVKPQFMLAVRPLTSPHGKAVINRQDPLTYLCDCVERGQRLEHKLIVHQYCPGSPRTVIEIVLALLLAENAFLFAPDWAKWETLSSVSGAAYLLDMLWGGDARALTIKERVDDGHRAVHTKEATSMVFCLLRKQRPVVENTLAFLSTIANARQLPFPDPQKVIDLVCD